MKRTRAAIFDALIRLIFERRYDAIRTADVIEAAGVGRSTFYEHFRNKDEVLLAVIEPVFIPLAAAASGRTSRAALKAMLEHVWPQRALTRMLFEPPLLSKLQRKLATMIEARWPMGAERAAALLSAGNAAGQMAMLRMWLIGEVSCSSDELAGWFMEFSAPPAPTCTDMNHPMSFFGTDGEVR
ncbi:helix-turn-helix domain-containing protein [Brevundimonas sp. C43]|uniref:TetR/AcrR family transcriptional regulator n=1 Tax=Brevundimonas sp. C43 TaxID=3068314 RepID=UPI00273F0220|nr:helix-turn-helix domain-containing protein [Brevundimonas sp. C43]